MAGAVTKGDITFNTRTEGSEFAPGGGFKLVVRMLPPLLKAGDFFCQIAPFLPTEWMRSNYYVEGHYPTDTFKQPVYSRCYIEFDSFEHMRQFATEVRTTGFYNSQNPPNVETTTLSQNFTPVLEQCLHTNIATPEESDLVFSSPRVTNKFKRFHEMLEDPLKFEKPVEASAEEMFFKPILNVPKVPQKKEAPAKEVKPTDKDAEKREAKLKRKKKRGKKKEEKKKDVEKENTPQSGKPKILKRPKEATESTPESNKRESTPEARQKKGSTQKPRKDGPEKKPLKPKKESRESTLKPNKEGKPNKPRREKPREATGEKPKAKPKKPSPAKEAPAANTAKPQKSASPENAARPASSKGEKKPRVKKPKKPAE